MKQFIILLVMSLCLASCQTQKDEIKEEYLAGRLTYSNPLTPEITPLPLSGRQVKIADNEADIPNYSRSVLTDSSGYFVISHLKKGNYVLFVEDSINHLLCKGQVTSSAPKDNVSLVIKPDTNSYNFVRIRVVTPSQAPVSGASVCVFNNTEAWQQDTCKGSLYNLPLPENGQIIYSNVPSGMYYYLCSTEIGGIRYLGKTSRLVTATGITDVKIELQPVSILPPLYIDVTDIFGSPVSNTGVCIFTNYSQSLADTCLGSTYQTTTNELGRATTTGLKPGTYYFFCSTVLNNVYQRGKATATITTSAHAPISLTVSPVPPASQTGFKLIVTDKYNTPVNGATACLFSNYTQFTADTCFGSIRQGITDDNGEWIVTGLQVRTYYIRVTLKVGDVLLKKMEEIDVINNQIINKPVQLP